MSSDETRSDLAVMDGNEFKNKRRLRGLLDAHDQVEETADRLFEMQAAGKISEDARNIGIQRAVKRFIRESWNLLASYDPEEDGDAVPNPYTAKLGAIPMQWEEPVQIVGLGEFLQTDEWYSESVTRTREARHGPDQQATQRQRHTVPADVSWSAHLTLWEFLDAYKDLDIQFEDLNDELPTWGFEEVDDEDIEDTADLARERMQEDDSGQPVAADGGDDVED